VRSRTVSCDAAREDKFLNHALVAIGFGNRLHYASSARYIDLPHAVEIEYAHANLIQDECKMDDGDSTRFTQEVVKLAAGLLPPQIHPHEAQRLFGGRGLNVYPDH